MKKEKMSYEAPTTDVLVVRFEESLLTGSPEYGTSGAAGSSLGLDDDNYNYGSF